MRELVGAPDFVGRFAVLMIVRLDVQQVAAGAWVFDPKGNEAAVALEVDSGH